jgi:multisubunit Na+/H+ antiporter MnhE subunit
MFIALFVILLVLWILGFTAMHVASFAIHLLLIGAIVALIVHFVRPRRNAGV